MSAHADTPPRRRSNGDRGFALFFIIGLCLGLVTVVLLYANGTALAYRASGNAAAAAQARQAVEGAQRYVAYLLRNLEEPGYMPDVETYAAEGVPLDEATFWFVGRDANEEQPVSYYFSLMDEGAKLNLNTATLEMIEAVPYMTTEFAAAIVDWRDADEDLTPGGAETANYLLLDPPYQCKNAPFETVEELRLVYGAEWAELIGEDLNFNHVLDPNEDDGDALPPDDNQDGVLDRGIMAYFTVYSAEPNTDEEGETRVNINGNETDRLEQVLRERLSDRASSVMQALQGSRGRDYQSVLEFFYATGLSVEEFAEIEPYLTVSEDERIRGLVNVNTAPEEVLVCIPGIGVDHAADLVAARTQKTAQELRSVAWVSETLDQTAGQLAGPYLTTWAYRVSADVAAVGRNGRGFARTRFVFDTSGDEVVVVARQDLSRSGWPLDEEARTMTSDRRTLR